MPSSKVPILFENDRIIIINKPAGVSVTADRTGAADVSALLSRQLTLNEPLRLVHRLDKDTSGVMLLAKHRDAQSRYSRLFAKRLAGKLYLAIVTGPVAEPFGSIKDPIARSRRNRRAMHVHPRLGKPAHTLWRRMADFGGPALLAAQPITGRTHQIRIHFAHRQMPLFIDPVYGQTAPLMLSAFKKDYRAKPGRAEPPLIDRLTLHAYQLAVPIGDEASAPYHTFVARPEKHFLAAVKMLAKHSPAISGRAAAFDDSDDLDRILAGRPLEFLDG